MGPFNLGTDMFSFLFAAVFILVFGMIIFTIVRGLTQWGKNNNSPTLTVGAKIVSKRTNVGGGHHHAAHANGGGMHYSSHTTYYVTFEFESGDRLELTMPGSEYGLLAEGDTGRLTFQGTRYKGFERM